MYNSIVTQYESNDQPSVTLSNGKKFYADLIVNAGGLGSLRKSEQGVREREDWEETGMSVYS
jgi:L-2-hydroxyglutarate oxidase LhgO